ncbi:MAG: hypothetical protein LBQ22_07085 [Bacteroidales bacterium]|nr:hypothetical protein [Bacteroidales bacterium]
MSKENFLSRVIDEESSARIEGLSQNKTLYVDQFTSSVSCDNMGLAMEEVEENGNIVGKYPRNLKEVFDYFKPEVKVEFSDENKETISETLKFKEIKDFDIDNGNGNLVTNSSFLVDLKNKKEGCEKVKKSIEKNAKLREILKNPDTKNELKELLESMLEELNNAK